MGDIKSTLDLVMERTRHLTLSPEERAAQKEENLVRGITTLVNRFRRQELTIEAFADSIRGMTDVSDPIASAVPVILEQVDPDADNTALCTLLEEACGRNTRPLRRILKGYQNRRTRTADEQRRQIAERLARSGITGTAVSVNLEGDADWRQTAVRLRESFGAERAALTLPATDSR